MNEWRTKYWGSRRDAGESLIEIIMAIALLSGAVITLLYGLLDSFSLASMRNGQATVNSAKRSISERIIALNKTACTDGPTITAAIQALNSSSLGVTVGTPTYESGVLSGTTITWTSCGSQAPTGVLRVTVPYTWHGLSITGTATTNTGSFQVVTGQ